MNKIPVFLYILLFMALQHVNAQQLLIEKVRDQFFSLDKTEGGALQLYKMLENDNLDKQPILLAYRGAVSAAAAGTVTGVGRKLHYFNYGKTELEKAVMLKPIDAEIRFLRLATQVNAPRFLGYNEDINSDKVIILKTLNSLNADHPNAYLYLRICRFLLTHAELNTTEKNTVKLLIIKFNTRNND